MKRSWLWSARTAAIALLCAANVAVMPCSAPAQIIGGRATRLRNLPERFGNKNSSIHYDPAVLAPGVTRERVLASFGTPNATRGTGAAREDVYAFHPDGSKFVEPQMSAGTIAAAVFTGGMSLAVRKARTTIQENQLTLYHVHYDAEDKIASVQTVPPKIGASEPASPSQ